MNRDGLQRCAVFAGSACLTVEAIGYACSRDIHWLAAGAASGICAVVLLVLARPRRVQPTADDDPFEGTPGLIDSRHPFTRASAAVSEWYWQQERPPREDLQRAFADLDRELMHPARLHRRIACARARQRDRVGVSKEERVAWIDLWTRLEDNGDGMCGVGR